MNRIFLYSSVSSNPAGLGTLYVRAIRVFARLQKYFVLPILFLPIILFSVGCNDDPSGPAFGELQYIGFERKFPVRLAVFEPYLYVCAASDGIWRKNIGDMASPWEYLGLSDASLGKYGNVGAVDFDVFGSEILVAYNAGVNPSYDPSSTVAVWRSTNGGVDWTRSDKGIPETRRYSEEYNVLFAIKRSPHLPNIVIGQVGDATYRSEDGGRNWTLIQGRRGVIANEDRVKWNPNKPGEVWFFGSGSVFSAYLAWMLDYGTTFGGVVDLNQFDYQIDNSVLDLEFHSQKPDVIYAVTHYDVIKTTDGGKAWAKRGINMPVGDLANRLVNDPRYTDRFYIASSTTVYFTDDGGITVHEIAESRQGYIMSAILDISGNRLVVGTTNGIYFLYL